MIGHRIRRRQWLMLRHTARVAATLVILAGAAWAVGCASDKPAGPSGPELTLTALIVSDPVPGALPSAQPRRDRGDPAVASFATAAAADVVYVSLPPGSIPAGEAVTIRNRRTGIAATAAMVDGGFDPLPVPALAGDVLDVEVRLARGAGMQDFDVTVPARRPPRVVRTYPPRGKRDVALNATIVIVFSEPLDVRTITSESIRLSRAGEGVVGRLSLTGDGLWAEFQPDNPLAPETEYTLAITTAVADPEGDRLEQSFQTTFTTLAAGDTPSTLHVKTTTTGVEVPTSYLVNVASPARSPVTPGPGASFYVSVNATVAIHLPPGDYSVNLGSVSLNCDPGATSLPVTVPSGGSATVEFAVACVPPSILAFLRTGEIYTTNSNLTALTRLTDGESSKFGWSPDGGRIAFTSTRDGDPEIYVINADGTAQTRLTVDPSADVFVSWSPDGGKIAFSSDRDGAFAYYVMNADGTSPTPVPNDPGWTPDPARSPDGTKMAVLADATTCIQGGEGWSGCVTDTDLYAMSLDGSGAMQLLASGLGDWNGCSGWSNVTCETRHADPAWSADGRLIAVTYTECDHAYYGCYPPSLRLVRADGSGRWAWLADDWVQYAWRPSARMTP